MKHALSTQMTREALASSLKKLMEQKPLSQISIREIIEDCGVNRQTFYYHFRDIYALAEWMFSREAAAFICRRSARKGYLEALQAAIVYAQTHPLLKSCAMDVQSHDAMRRLFGAILRRDIAFAVNLLSAGLSVDDSYREFLISFYSEAVASIILNWMCAGAPQEPELLVRYVDATLTSGIPAALKQAAHSSPA